MSEDLRRNWLEKRFVQFLDTNPINDLPKTVVDFMYTVQKELLDMHQLQKTILLENGFHVAYGNENKPQFIKSCTCWIQYPFSGITIEVWIMSGGCFPDPSFVLAGLWVGKENPQRTAMLQFDDACKLLEFCKAIKQTNDYWKRNEEMEVARENKAKGE